MADPLNQRQQIALWLDSRGWVVVPAYRADHPSGGKLPIGRDWQNRQRLRPDQIVANWGGANPANISILTGTPSGIFVVDVDPAGGGVDSMRALIAANGPLPPTFTVRTGGGGWHFYFQMPDFELGNRAGTALGRGVDIRGTGGQVIAPGSVSNKGPYSPQGDPSTPVAAAPTWMLELLRPREILPAAGPISAEGLAAANSYEEKAVTALIGQLQAMTAAAAVQPYAGEPWDATTYRVACRLFEIANADWSSLTPNQVTAIVMEHAPRDPGFDDHRVADKIRSAAAKIGTKAAAPPQGTAPRNDFITEMAREQGVLHAPPPVERTITTDRTVDVSNPALAARWLMASAGSGGLSGMFFRKGEVVHTASIGEEGFVEVKAERAEFATSISAMSSGHVRARITSTHQVVKQVEDKRATSAARKTDEDAPAVYKAKPALFPLEAADILVQAPDLAPSLRILNGVVHTPTVRPDGSIITTPGYDWTTGLLYLPVGPQPAHIPDEPTISDVEMAVKWLDYMLQDFSFVSEHDKASYLGLMLTPLLRTMVPPPYKLGVIEAHQPGSGKSYLARALMSIHGGLEQSGLAPTDEELGKSVGAILDTQTAPVVVFDNVDGMVRSPLLAGLLTSPTFSMRRLGSSTRIEASNDRLWIMTANNATLSGDLGRRNMRVRVDPGVPQPELRTGFAIDDFEGWTRTHRADLLWALLVLVRNWVQRGRPIGTTTKDSYGSWIGVLRGILHCAGVQGIVDDISTSASAVDPEADEFGGFLAAIQEQFADRPWSTKDLLLRVAHPAMPNDPSRPIPFDSLPEWVTSKHRGGDPIMLARSLGKGLLFRQGRFFGKLQVLRAGHSRVNTAIWRVNESTR